MDPAARPIPVRTGPVPLGLAHRPEGTRMRVHLTVDTECSHGGVFHTRDPRVLPVGPARRIWGKVWRKEYGIRRMMDILDGSGLKATFFLEPFASFYFGETEFRRAATEIRSRGHGLELHLHPNYRIYRDLDPGELAEATTNPWPGKMWSYPPGEQEEMIREAAAMVEDWGGRRPVAFRAGGYAADAATLAAVRGSGLRFDFSAIHPEAGPFCRLWSGRPPNAPRLEEGLILLPVTTFVARGLSGRPRRRILEISAVTLGMTARVLADLDAAGVTDAVLMLHSFSFLRSYGEQYRFVRPDRLVVRRFEELVRHLAERRDRYEVLTVSELAEQMEGGAVAFGGPDTDPAPGRRSGVARDLVQALNRW